MVQFDNQYRQIKIKVVYYGPALGGKTTCLQHIHSVTDPDKRTKLYSLNTASDRTLFFDLLALNLGKIRGYDLALQLYTVPGQVQYDATRRAVLSAADGVVFVADSQEHCRDANLESLENLWANLAANGLDRKTVPLVFQYNKRDLDRLISVDDLDAALNPLALTAVPTIAVQGEGVMEGFAAISQQTLGAVAHKLGVGSNPAAVERLQQQVRVALQPFMSAGAGPEGDQVRVTVAGGVSADDQPMSQEMLVAEAVRANLAMTDLNARLDTMGRRLRRKVEVLNGVHDYGTLITDQRDPLAVMRCLLTSAVELLQVPAAAVLSVPGSGQMHEVAVHGVGQDPLLSTSDGVGEPLAMQLVAERSPLLIHREMDDAQESLYLAAVNSAGFSSALVVPLVAHEQILGLLTAYGDVDRTDFDHEDLQLASVLTATAAMGCANARSFQELERINRGLESQVDARTEELKRSLDEVRRLAEDLEGKNRLIDDAYRELSELDRVKDELINRLAAELKSPVSSVAQAAKILHNYSDNLPPKGARFISIIREETDKLSEVIQSIFQASVLAGAQKKPECEPVLLEDLFKRAIMPLRDAASGRQLKLKVLIPAGLEALFCERSTMEPALRAVFKNAIEFNREGGEVKVAVRRVVRESEPWVVVSVSDTGLGIPEADLDHVFDTFWQGDNIQAGRPRGVGLGLAITKMVVENHGGSITVSSREGEGTEVTITLPQGT